MRTTSNSAQWADMVKALVMQRDPFDLTEIVDLTGIPKTTCDRMLRFLEEVGLVTVIREGHRKRKVFYKSGGWAK